MVKTRGPKKKETKAIVQGLGKHKTFEDGENDNECEMEINSGLNSRSIKLQGGDEDEEAPEEFFAADDSVQQLKRLHESILTEQKIKKRKPAKNALVSTDSNKPLDISILDSISAVNNNSSDDLKTDGSAAGAEKSHSTFTTLSVGKEVAKNKKIGNIEISTLESASDLLSAYPIPRKALVFAASVTNSLPRVRYSIFAAQKKPGPAKRFTKVTKR